jgi:hypothetical protein
MVTGFAEAVIDVVDAANYMVGLARKWRNWQTRRIQDPVG